jgi:hypothetical protein
MPGSSRKENAVSHGVDPIPRSRRRLWPAAALVAAVGACALLATPVVTTVGAGAASPTVTKVLTNASNGTTVVVTKGFGVEVKLASDGFRWTEASVINAGPEVVLQFVSGHVNPNGSSVTDFRVVGYGEVTLLATGVKKCSHNPACTPTVKVWRADVISYVAS